ncbi:MAG: S-methyl-5'-thioadenosine phosphorylase [Acidobacteriota bacterium]
MGNPSIDDRRSGDYRIGVIGGSGLYQMDDLDVHAERRIETPFGPPSDSFILGELDGQKVAFLARHGRGHRLSPTELNFRANIYAMKTLGVEWLISVSAVGSMKEEYEPLHVVVPDQFFDRTRHRVDTFFGQGLVAHVSLADPVCPVLASVMADSAEAAGGTVHRGGTYLCMEGPQFSTRAESEIYRGWGVDVIGMTNYQEARLAREAEIAYATYAMITDYDCWHQGHDDVTVDAVIEVLMKNAALGQGAVRGAVRALADKSHGDSPCHDALKHALITDPAMVPASTLERLRPIVGRYFPEADD